MGFRDALRSSLRPFKDMSMLPGFEQIDTEIPWKKVESGSWPLRLCNADMGWTEAQKKRELGRAKAAENRQRANNPPLLVALSLASAGHD